MLEEFLFGRRFRSLAIPLQFLGKVLLVNVLSIVAHRACLRGGPRAASCPFLQRGMPRMARSSCSAQFYRCVVRVVVVTTIAILVVQVEELIGRRMFLGFLLGRYDKPKAEERIMLSIDLVGSTALAERLGDLRYFRFLNKTYSLMTDAVLRNEADIHKYIGDEVIFTWPMAHRVCATRTASTSSSTSRSASPRTRTTSSGSSARCRVTAPPCMAGM